MVKKAFGLVGRLRFRHVRATPLLQRFRTSDCSGEHPSRKRPLRQPSGEAKKPIVLVRAPVRTIEDPNSSFSAVAVDVARDEIVLEDENLDQIMVYGRLDNTPAQASLTEPKRVIGGSHTKISENCGLYVDPFSGDIYSVNGDTANYLTVWSREAEGKRTLPTAPSGYPASRLSPSPSTKKPRSFSSPSSTPPAVVVYPQDGARETTSRCAFWKGTRRSWPRCTGLRWTRRIS